MDNNNNNEIYELLGQINQNSLSDDDKEAMKKILEKYSLNKNNTEPEFSLEPEFEIDIEQTWEDPNELADLKEQGVVIEPALEEKIINPQVDENGQYLLDLENNQQLELDLDTSVSPNKDLVQDVPNVETTNQVNNDQRIEPVFSLDSMDVSPRAIDMPVPSISNQRFNKFESMAQNSLGKVKNFFNFKDENGKLDWHNVYAKSVLVVSSTTNALLDNKVVNGLKSFIGNKFKSSKIGIHTTKIADTLTVNLMSREDRYNKDFKNTMALMGYSVKELINPTNEPMLSLEDVAINIKKELSDSLSVNFGSDKTTIKALENLSPEQTIESINKFIWPKITSMLEESIKLSYAARETRDKNPLYKKIQKAAQLNNISEELFVHYLLKDPEFLEKNKCKGIGGLLLKKDEIENLYFKLEEISAKNFVVMQNLVKVGLAVQKTISDLPMESKEEKQALLSSLNKTVISSKNNKQILFNTLQESVLESLNDNDYKKSLVEINSSILKIREINQNKEQNNKPKI